MTGPEESRDVPAPPDVPAAPRLLSHRADPLPLPTPLHDDEVVASLHRSWAQLAGAGQGATSPAAGDPGDATGGVVPGTRAAGRPAGGGSGSGVRAKVRARVVAAARADAAADRALIGDLIRAVDALAARADEIATRVCNLELLVQEVLDRLSEDLVRVQATLGALGALGALGEGAHDETS